MGNTSAEVKATTTAPADLDVFNEDDYVAVDDCKDCPDDSGCIGRRNFANQSICHCYHETPVVPLRKDEKCKRNTVKVFNNSDEIHSAHDDVQHIPVNLQKNSTASIIPSPVSSTNVAVATILACTMVFFLALLVIMLLSRKRRFRKLFSKEPSRKLEMGDVELNGGLLLPTDRFVSNPTYETTNFDLNIRVFSPSQVILSIQIGQGCFGKVYRGELEGEEVAVKLVKKGHSDEAIKEVETMATFSHPNILRLIGIVRSSESDVPWLVFEFMKHGDLASVLRKCVKGNLGSSIANNKVNEVVGAENGSDILHLSVDDLMNFATQIAEGMKYLSSQHFVHRDLAARNCLVSSTGQVKISDFGMSRDVYTCDYYKIGGSRLLPLRWMAPESILYGRFTLESDVWAYGVLLWEIFTWGKQPYYGHSNEEVVQLILDGVLLCPPSDCPIKICQIMEGCWKTDPKDRLKFHQMPQKLGAKESAQKEDMEYSKVPGKRSHCPQFEVEEPEGCSFQSWLESGYEIPRNILNREYLKVV